MTSVQSSAAHLGTLDAEAIDQFRAGLVGASLTIGEIGYEEARTHRNGMIKRYPGMIVRCQGNADVISAVNLAREHNLLLSVRGGGHNVAGNALNDGGVVIDLSAMRGVRVDPSTGTVWAQGGATWRDMDAETQIFGLAVPGGVVSTTGVGGLTLHGGMGHLRRQVGLSIDSLLSVDIVTADGQLRHSSDSENPDLFWAVRGAGSNFGVVTGLRFQAHAVGPMVQVAAVFYDASEIEAVLRGFRDFTVRAPDEVSAIVIPWSVPDAPHFPEDLRGVPAVIVAAVSMDSDGKGEATLEPLRHLGSALLDLSGPWPWTGLQTGFDALFPIGRHYYWKSTFIDDLSDQAIGTIAHQYQHRPGPLTDIVIWHLGGAIAGVDPGATAYYRRQAPYLMTAEASWDDPDQDETHVSWAREALKAVEPFSQGGAYINFAGFGEEREALLRSSFGPNYDRLVEIKSKYDPTNLFRMNLNIPPRTDAG